MFISTPEILMLTVALAVLAGSLFGSAGAFLVRGGSEGDAGPGYGPAPSANYGTGRFANWRPEHFAAPEDIHPPRRRLRLLPLAVLLAVAYGVGSVGYFAYKSPWPVLSDLRHLAAGLNCEAARVVGLAPAYAGAPGYHAKYDADGNGLSCESAALQTAALPKTRLSDTPLTLPVK